jgi:hypothetical protein
MKKILVFLALFSLFGLGYATPISGCTTLSTSGNYELTQNIQLTTSPCIAITGNNVSLDCQGHTINGNFGGGMGIGTIGKNNIIRKCVLTGLNIGLGMSQAKNTTVVENAFSTTNAISIFTWKGENNTFSKNAIQHFRLYSEKNFISSQNSIQYAYLDGGTGITDHDTITKVKLCHAPQVFVNGSIIQSVEIGCD